MHQLDESLLASLPLFSQIKRPQLRVILDQATSRRFDVGTQVFQEGAPASQFFLLLDGTIRVVKVDQNGDQVTSLHIPSGQLFGIGKALGHKTYPATAITASEAVVLAWPTALWEGFVADNPGFAAQTYTTVGHRINEMNARIFELSKLHVAQRVARALLRLIDQSGKPTDLGIEIGFPITRQDLSEMTGTTLHTVSRLLSTWEKDGLVLSKRKKIIVCAPDRLALLSEE